MAFLGSDPSAAGGGYSEVSEWQRSKFQAFAVRQRRNFGHRNRTLLPPRAKVTRPGARNTLQKRADVGIRPYEKARWNSVGADDSVGPIDGGTVIVRADRVVRPYNGLTIPCRMPDGNSPLQINALLQLSLSERRLSYGTTHRYRTHGGGHQSIRLL